MFGVFFHLVFLVRYEVVDFEEISRSYKDIRWLACFPSCIDGMSVLDKCKFGVLQYTIVRTVTSFIA